MAVVGPLAEVDSVVVYVAENGGGELRSFRNDVASEEVLHTGRGLAAGEFEQLVGQKLLERFLLLGIFLVELGKHGVDALRARRLLLGALEKIRADHDTLERRSSLQRSVLDIAGLVAEDGAEQFFLGGRVALSLRRDLTDHDVAGNNVGAHTDNTALVEVFGSVFADVGNIGCQLFHTALCLAHLEGVFVDMNRGQYVFADHALVQHDGILVVISFPGHEGYLQVASEGKLAVFGRIAFGQNVAFVDALALLADRAQVDCSALVGLAEFRQMIFLDGILESHELFLFGAVVADADHSGVDKLDHAGAFGHHLSAAVADKLAFETGSDDRSLAAHQRHSLAHHVRSHERAVGVVVLEEGNQAGCDRGDLHGAYVHQLYLLGGHDGEVGILTGFDALVNKCAVVVDKGASLSDHLALFGLGSHIDYLIVLEVDDAVLNSAVGRLDKAQVIDFRIDAERRDQTDVRAFRRLDRAEAAIVGIVDVTHLESGALTRQAAGTQGTHTALVGHLGQRVCLIHELAQGVGAEEGVDDA